MYSRRIFTPRQLILFSGIPKHFLIITGTTSAAVLQQKRYCVNKLLSYEFKRTIYTNLKAMWAFWTNNKEVSRAFTWARKLLSFTKNWIDFWNTFQSGDIWSFKFKNKYFISLYPRIRSFQHWKNEKSRISTSHQ